MFTFAQILVCALVGFVASLAMVLARQGGTRAAIELGLVTALSILLWRSAANTAALNDDPIPWVSPNDVLCPVVTYVALGVHAGLRGRDDRATRALLTLVSLVVNVLTI